MLSRLKSLELHGYKTFASRTQFEFPGKITAIVGPNGSGKSNVADAIRWVLGEQSYSLLRGRKTEDMIFAGSELRPRASMASAMITFDNDDGWLPIDYSEVSIARRAYRDGQNEYVLNNQRVRLKEISELLAQSGLAERTYTIIGQGLVDVALSLKPEERRRFFEEAAGIGLYRTRKEEAINRLDNTRRNLERVHDILGELEPRLRSLEKQAARFLEYERVKADLRVLLREWYGYHWHRSQVDVSHAREVLASSEGRLQQARQRYQEVESRVKGLRDELQNLRGELSQLHSKSAVIHSQRETISRTLAVLDERQRALTEQESTFQSDLSRLEEEEKIHLERFQSMQAELDDQKKALQEAQEQSKNANRLLQARQAERDKVGAFLRDLRRQMVGSETRQVEIRAHQNELSSRQELLRKERERLTQASQSIAQVVEQSSGQLKIAQEQHQNLELQLQAFESDLLQIQQKTLASETRRQEFQEQTAQHRAEMSRLQAQIEVLEQAESSMSGMGQGSKTILQAAQQGRLKGKFNAINSLVEVPAEYEVAIAAVLGENLDAIALDPDASPDAVIEMLSGSNQGRTVIYPQDWLKMEGDLPVSADPDCLGRAVDLVAINPDQQKVFRLLLGQVLVARTRTAARRIAGQQPLSTKVVSLQGEVFFGNGAVSAGQEGRQGVMARPRQIRELKESAQNIQNLLAQVEMNAGQTQSDLEGLKNQRGLAETRIRETRQKISQAARELQQAALAVEQARQKEEWQRGQIAQAGLQLDTASAEIKQIAAEMKKLEAEQESLDLQIREHQHKIDQVPLDEYQTQVVHWNTQVAVTQRSLGDSGRRLAEYQQALENNRSSQLTLKKRLEQSQELLKKLELEKGTSRQQEGELNAAIEALRSETDPAEAHLNDLETRYERMQGDLSAAQQAVSLTERHTTQAQLEFGRLRDNLDNLRRRVEEDFGLVAFEYQHEIAGPTPLPLDGMVEQLPTVVEIPSDLEENLNRQRGQLRRMGSINPEAQSEYQSVKERYQFLSSQVVDLKKADEDLRLVIAELDALMKREFVKTFDSVAIEFKTNFTRLFGGGSARLVLADEDNPAEGGIDIEARLPGRREQGLSLLSGGERSLTAVALIFSLLKVSPTPFCVLDEVDAMLDEANVSRFCELLEELSQNTQFVVITHNRNTVQIADVIYGVTMGKDTASQVISLRLDEINEELVK